MKVGFKAQYLLLSVALYCRDACHAIHVVSSDGEYLYSIPEKAENCELVAAGKVRL